MASVDRPILSHSLAARGFLPTPDPATRLPTGLSAWDEIGDQMPKLLASGRLHDAVRTLPLLDASGLRGPTVERAMVVLSFVGHAYVWQNWRTPVDGHGAPDRRAGPADRIPANLAMPWHQVATMLGRPPVLSYASYALYNWRRLDPAGPIAVGNLALIQNFLGGVDEEWFVVIHVDIEAKAGPALAAIEPAQAAAGLGDAAAVTTHLRTMAGALAGMYSTLERMPEWCDPYIYYQRVRPYIHGFYHHPVVYEGVDEYGGQAQRFFGETGAQSSIIPAIDAALGIEHQNDDLRVYLNQMRDYMPPAHRAFIARVERGPSIRAFVERAVADAPALRARYDECVHWVERFRSKHLEYAAAYIQRQAQRGANLTTYGTGGTPFMPYLKKHRDETARHAINPAPATPDAA